MWEIFSQFNIENSVDFLLDGKLSFPHKKISRIVQKRFLSRLNLNYYSSKLLNDFMKPLINYSPKVFPFIFQVFSENWNEIEFSDFKKLCLRKSFIHVYLLSNPFKENCSETILGWNIYWLEMWFQRFSLSFLKILEEFLKSVVQVQR